MASERKEAGSGPGRSAVARAFRDGFVCVCSWPYHDVVHHGVLLDQHQHVDYLLVASCRPGRSVLFHPESTKNGRQAAWLHATPQRSLLRVLSIPKHTPHESGSSVQRTSGGHSPAFALTSPKHSRTYTPRKRRSVQRTSGGLVRKSWLTPGLAGPNSYSTKVL